MVAEDCLGEADVSAGYGHLEREDLLAVSRRFHDLAHQLVEIVPEGPERTVSLRKLLEAKDAAVRAVAIPVLVGKRARPIVPLGPTCDRPSEWLGLDLSNDPMPAPWPLERSPCRSAGSVCSNPNKRNTASPVIGSFRGERPTQYRDQRGRGSLGAVSAGSVEPAARSPVVPHAPGARRQKASASVPIRSMGTPALNKPATLCPIRPAPYSPFFRGAKLEKQFGG